MWAAIRSGAAEADPSLLQPLLLLTYADLKHFKYRYWFAFPALQPPTPFAAAAPPASLAAALGASAAAAVAAACSAHVAGSAGPPPPAWLVCVDRGAAAVATAPLSDWHRLQQVGGGGLKDVYLAAADSSNQSAHPGWPLRNLLLLVAARWACGERHRVLWILLCALAT